MIKEIFCVSSIVLGLFIIINHINSHGAPLFKTDTSYHIGCYDSEMPHSHSSDLEGRVREIEARHGETMHLSMYKSVALQEDFERRVREVARTFESYLDEYYQIKIKSEHDLHFYNSLKVAKRKYERCVQDLPLDAEDCARAWEEYREVSV